jgi:hypothetical protein
MMGAGYTDMGAVSPMFTCRCTYRDYGCPKDGPVAAKSVSSPAEGAGAEGACDRALEPSEEPVYYSAFTCEHETSVFTCILLHRRDQLWLSNKQYLLTSAFTHGHETEVAN